MMKSKTTFVILGSAAAIAVAVTLYFTTTNRKPALDEKALKDTVFSAVENALKALHQSTGDPGYATWDKKVDITSVDVSQKAAKGRWWQHDAWGWIAWQQENGNWKVLLSFDGFNCHELDGIPSRYAAFSESVIYAPDGKKYCY